MKENRILIAEDDKILANLIRDILANSGYSVEVANDGREALELAKRDHFCIVVTDIEMPVMDGYELVVHLNEMKNPPLIFVITCNDESSFIIDVMKQGVYDYIIKPLDINTFLTKINRAREVCELKRIKDIAEKEKKIRLDNQMEWLQWQKKMEVKNGKIDRSLFQNMHISFSQGIGFGALITLLNIIFSSTCLKDGNYVIDSEIMNTIKKNMLMAENAIAMFSDIEWVISNQLELKKFSCRALHGIVAEVKDSLSAYEGINKNSIKLSDPKCGFSDVYANINEKYFCLAVKEILVNALKFSEKNSVIYVLLDVSDRHYSLTVINTPRKDAEGRKGIPMEYENLIFEPFFRMTKTVNEQFDTFDYGLGLVLVDKVMEKHMGKVTGQNITDYSNILKDPEVKVAFNVLLPLESAKAGDKNQRRSSEGRVLTCRRS